MDASHEATMMRVRRQKVREGGAFDNPWSAWLSVKEAEKEKTKDRMTPRPPSSSPPRRSKGTQTEKEKEKEEEEEDKEQERKNFVKKVDAMIRFLKNGPPPPRARPRPSGKLTF